MVLPYIKNSFDDAVMYTKKLPPELVEKSRFASEINETFMAWKAEGLNAAWVYINKEDSHVVPHLAELGFDFVHATKGEVAMNCWLSDKPSRLPPTTSSYYSVSAMVLDRTGRVLMVCDQHRKSMWRFPGGAPSQSESLFETAERKVLEETGVAAKGETIISVRQKLGTNFSGSCAFFFTCLMKYDGNAIVARDKTASADIADVKWFTRVETKSLPRQNFYHYHHKIWQAYLKSQEGRGGYEATEKRVNTKKLNFSFL